MKKIIVAALFCMGTLAVNAQGNEPFEGKLSYRSLENHDEALVKHTYGIAYNGARNTTFLIKGNKVLFRDECTHMSTLFDPDNNVVILYSELIGKGVQFDYESYAASNMGSFSENGPMFQGQMVSKPSVYRIEATGKTTDFQGEVAKHYQCRIENVNGGTSIDLYQVDSYNIPTTMFAAQMYGLKMNGLITKFTWETMDKVGGFVGDLKAYVFSELTNIDKRSVDDSEFDIPQNIKIDKSKSPLKMQFKLIALYKANTKYLTEHNMYPTQTANDVIYKIDEEWDF